MLSNHPRRLLVPLPAALLLVALACGSGAELPLGQTSVPTATPTRTTLAHETLPTPPRKQYDAPPEMQIDPNKTYTATIVLEKGGEIIIDLFAKEVPTTVNNFVFLARDGFYDGVTFHRVLLDMVQAGDPTGTGKGGPGYWIENEFRTDLRHDEPGVVSMWNAGIRKGAAATGSQFLITLKAKPDFDGLKADGSQKNCGFAGASCFPVFGRVIEGMEVVKGLKKRNPQPFEPPGDVIKTITIQEGQ